MGSLPRPRGSWPRPREVWPRASRPLEAVREVKRSNFYVFQPSIFQPTCNITDCRSDDARSFFSVRGYTNG